MRAVTLSAINLESADTPRQISLFGGDTQEKYKKAEEALDKIKARFGDGAIKPAVLLCDNKMPEDLTDKEK